jgi:hypothetical protein
MKKYGKPYGPRFIRLMKRWKCENCGEKYISHKNYLDHKKKCDKEVEIWGKKK